MDVKTLLTNSSGKASQQQETLASARHLTAPNDPLPTSVTLPTSAFTEVDYIPLSHVYIQG